MGESDTKNRARMRCAIASSRFSAGGGAGVRRRTRVTLRRQPECDALAPLQFRPCSGAAGMTNDIVVVAAEAAFSFYKRHSAYVCQNGRTFRDVRYVARYGDKRIMPFISLI